MGGGGSLEASMVFEKLFSDYLRSHDEALRALLIRKFELMRAERPILSDIQISADGGVSISIREAGGQDTVAALSDAFDTLIDITGFFMSQEEAFISAMNAVSMVEKQFSEPFGRLGVREHILRGAMAETVPSGIGGLDSVLGKGLPASDMVMLFGPPGTAKYLFALQFLAAGLNRGGSGLAVLSSMSVKEMRAKLSRSGVAVSACEATGRLKTVDWYSQKSRAVVGLEELGPVLVPSKDIANLEIAFSRALDELAFAPTTRAYVDIVTPALNEYELSDVVEFLRRQKSRLKSRRVASVFVVEEGAHDERVVSTLKHMADTVLSLTVDEQGALSVEVLSMASGRFRPGKVAVQVSSRGMSVAETAVDEAGMVAELCNIPLVAKDIAQRLVDAGFTDMEKLNGARETDLLAVEGISVDVVRSILEYTRTVEFSQRVLAGKSERWLKKAREQAAAGDFRKAKRSLQRALEIDQANTDAWTLLAELDAKLDLGGE
jgi:KaiC/GvpD/RAD55 family RecA-like ATPase